jgi:hypothetical protein
VRSEEDKSTAWIRRRIKGTKEGKKERKKKDKDKE